MCTSNHFPDQILPHTLARTHTYTHTLRYLPRKAVKSRGHLVYTGVSSVCLVVSLLPEVPVIITSTVCFSLHIKMRPVEKNTNVKKKKNTDLWRPVGGEVRR